MKGDDEWQVEALGQVLKRLREERAELEKGLDTDNFFLVNIRQCQHIETLTRDVLIEMVDHIKIYEGGNISIVFRFTDELRRKRGLIRYDPRGEVS